MCARYDVRHTYLEVENQCNAARRVIDTFVAYSGCALLSHKVPYCGALKEMI